eukprot:6457579-Amphidinium_carterae.2
MHSKNSRRAHSRVHTNALELADLALWPMARAAPAFLPVSASLQASLLAAEDAPQCEFASRESPQATPPNLRRSLAGI